MHPLPSPDLAPLTTLGVGGPARRVDVAETADEAVERVRAAQADAEPLLVVGGGSNLLVADAGFDGAALLVDHRGLQARVDDVHVELAVQAGEPWDALVERCAAEGWSGVEALSGIPGRVGATPIQNVGAYGQEVADTLVAVRAWDRAVGEGVELPAAECGFGYRSSRFKAEPGRWLVLEVVFRLRRSPDGAPVRYAELARALGVPVGTTAPLSAVRAEVLRLRRGKGMVLDPADPDTRSAGSFFTNPVLDATAAARLPAEAPRYPSGDAVKTSAAWLIEQAGFARGWGAELTGGRATLSTKHTLALTNRGGATADDLLALARAIRGGVDDRFGVLLAPEPVLVGCSL